MVSYDHLPIVSIESRKSIFEVYHSNRVTFYLYPLDSDLPYGYVVVQFYPWFNFYFPLFLGMVIYDNEFETKENKN